MKKLILAPAVAIVLTALAGAPVLAQTTSDGTLPACSSFTIDATKPCAIVMTPQTFLTNPTITITNVPVKHIIHTDWWYYLSDFNFANPDPATTGTTTVSFKLLTNDADKRGIQADLSDNAGYVIGLYNTFGQGTYKLADPGADGLKVVDSQDQIGQVLVGDRLAKEKGATPINAPTGNVKPKGTTTSATTKKTPGDYALTLSTNTVTTTAFVDKDKGVTLKVTGLKPHEKFHYSVSKHSGATIPNLYKEVQADAQGTWSRTVFGEAGSTSLDGFLGEYRVTVKSSAGVEQAVFTVANASGTAAINPKAGGDTGTATASTSTDKSSSPTPTELPRTGAEVTGLIAGGVLLAVGAVTVVITRRRGRK